MPGRAPTPPVDSDAPWLIEKNRPFRQTLHWQNQRFAQFVHYNDRVMMIRLSSVFLSSL
jgi:hypothetical protein